MITELALATVMVLLTVGIHAAGLYALSRLLRLEELEEAAEQVHPLSLRGMAATIIVILGLFVLHGIEIWLYAFLYLAIGSVDGLREAIYFFYDHLWCDRIQRRGNGREMALGFRD